MVEEMEERCRQLMAEDLTLAIETCGCHAMQPLVAAGNLHCEPFPFSHSAAVELAYNILFSSTITVALIGNATVIWIVLFHERMRTVTNYYLLNLAIADASISIFNTGFTWSYNFYYIWRFGEFYCRMNNLMGITPICASVFTMIVMSIDRYYAIVHPLRRRPGKKATVAMICLVWALAIVCGVPAALASKVEVNIFYDNSSGVLEDPLCLSDNFPDGTADDSQLFAMYNNALTVLEYVLPLLVLSVAYFRAGMVLRRKEQLGDSQHQRNVASKRKASNMLWIVVFIFLVVWFPYHAYFLFINYGGVLAMDRKTVLYAYVNIYWLGMSSSMYNPIIYYFMNKRFRVGFHYAFRWLPYVRSVKAEYCDLLSTKARNHSKTMGAYVSVSISEKSKKTAEQRKSKQFI